MSDENTVFWLGGKPGKQETLQQDTEAREAAMTEKLTALCAEAGVRFGSCTMSAGEYGSWLLEVRSSAGKQRVIWDGRGLSVKVETSTGRNAWREDALEQVPVNDEELVLNAVRSLLTASSR